MRWTFPAGKLKSDRSFKCLFTVNDFNQDFLVLVIVFDYCLFTSLLNLAAKKCKECRLSFLSNVQFCCFDPLVLDTAV